MSTWDEKAADAAIEYAKPTMRPVQTMSDHMADAFHEGARWQREALLSDEAVERVARALCVAAGESPDSNELWDEEPPWHYYTDEARAALTAALGEDET